MSYILENPTQVHIPYISINSPASSVPVATSNATGQENPPTAKAKKPRMPKDTKMSPHVQRFHLRMNAPKAPKPKVRVVATLPEPTRPLKDNRKVIYLPNGWSRQVPIVFSDFEDIDIHGIDYSLDQIRPSHFWVPCLCSHHSCITRTPYMF